MPRLMTAVRPRRRAERRVAELEAALEDARPILIVAAGFLDWLDGGIRDRLTREAFGYVRALRKGFVPWEKRGEHPLANGYVDVVGTALHGLRAGRTEAVDGH